jgi:hypothetical protein
VQVTIVGMNNGNPHEIEDVMTKNGGDGWRLHSLTTANDGAKDRVVATMDVEHA